MRFRWFVEDFEKRYAGLGGGDEAAASGDGGAVFKEAEWNRRTRRPVKREA